MYSRNGEHCREITVLPHMLYGDQHSEVSFSFLSGVEELVVVSRGDVLSFVTGLELAPVITGFELVLVVVDGAGDGDRMEEDIGKKESKEEGSGSKKIRFRIN
ncbi:hypothetical protein F2Q70_00003806 [Brassica cretica]|uniref:Uncharacterized protein n=1 Tax=Brassica cretica TaxID=69181 RepID=A0A8S9IYH2_BRACR|nr:hypothetical protein F2Q70_00003806 [Brassica cretica]